MELGAKGGKKGSGSPTLSHMSMSSKESLQQPVNFKQEQQWAVCPEKKRSDTPTINSIRQSVNITDGHASCGSWTPEEAAVHEKFRSTLKRKFQHLVEGVPNQGETRLLHEIYTELYITEGGGGGGGWVNDEHEVRQIERASWTESSWDTPIKCVDIFKPFSREDKPIRTVLTKGVAGIGKTVSVQKFIVDWAEGKANQDIRFILPLPFRELNLMRERTLRLIDLIYHFFQETKDPQIFSDSEQRVLFIFDGLDECRLPLDFHSNPCCSDVTEPALVDVLLTNLIKGHLLPSALLWITTRPAAASQIPPECVDQMTEIRGFNDPQKEEYLRKRISDENLASRAITHLKSSRSLYIMCHIPVFCWITATVVEKSLHQLVEMPRTLTQMYTYFLIIQTSIKKEKFTQREETDEEVIFRLGRLAFQQLEKGNLIFYEEDLQECCIDLTEASVYSGVCTQIFREESGLFQGKVFSFVHLSIQEFLAALYVFLCFSNTQRNMPEQQQTSQLSALFRAATLHDLHKTAVDLALKRKNGHLDLFLRFLLGLSLESNQNHLRHLLPELSSQSQSSAVTDTVQYVKQKIREDPSALIGTLRSNTGQLVNLFCCLNELNHHAVVEVIKMSPTVSHLTESERQTGSLSVFMLLPGQRETRKFVFWTSGEQLDEFDLQKYMETPEKDLTELLSPDEVLQKLVPVVRSSTSAKLCSCNLTQRSCKTLASVYSQQPSRLTELDLSNNDLQDAGAEDISTWLKTPQCKLEKLKLWTCSLTWRSCEALAKALRSHPSSLRELDLSYNDLQDGGVERICSWLQTPHCKLQKLKLLNCGLGEGSGAALGSALNTSLRHLDLSDNQLLDGAVLHLCPWLSNTKCKLEKLQLWGCNLTWSCEALAKALSSHPSSLRELDLSNNDLQDAGVEQICSWLQTDNCKLEKLELWQCYITYRGCAALASALRSGSSRLRELDLSENSLHESEMHPLLNLLKDPAHSLEKLQWVTDIHSCQDFSTFFQSRPV